MERQWEAKERQRYGSGRPKKGSGERSGNGRNARTMVTFGRRNAAAGRPPPPLASTQGFRTLKRGDQGHRVREQSIFAAWTMVWVPDQLDSQLRRQLRLPAAGRRDCPLDRPAVRCLLHHPRAVRAGRFLGEQPRRPAELWPAGGWPGRPRHARAVRPAQQPRPRGCEHCRGKLAAQPAGSRPVARSSSADPQLACCDGWLAAAAAGALDGSLHSVQSRWWRGFG